MRVWRFGLMPTASPSVSQLAWSRRSGSRVSVVLAVGVVGAGAAAVMAWATLRSTTLVDPKGSWLWQSSFVASYVAVGLHTWWRLPESRLGPLVAGGGLLLSVTSLTASETALAYTLGVT